MDSARVAKYAALQSVAEIFIGSLVHAFRIPLGGHVLSLNQALLLCRGIKGEPTRRSAVSTACGIANIAAVLKALSPIGKKLSPMVAIGMQGWLFAIGPGTLGPTLMGALIGSLLLSTWAFIHPLLMAYFFFGARFFEAIEKVWLDMAKALGWDPSAGIWILASLVGLKLMAAAAVCILSWIAPLRFEERYVNYLERQKERWISSASQPSAFGWFRGLLSPMFLASFALSFGFFVIGQNATLAEALFYLLRVIAAGLVFVWAARALPRSWIARWRARFPQLEAVSEQIFKTRSRGQESR